MRMPRKFEMIVMLVLVVETFLDMLPHIIFSAPVTFGQPYFTTASSWSEVVMRARYLIVKSACHQHQSILKSLWDHLKNGALTS